jgi:hypothetical protein
MLRWSEKVDVTVVADRAEWEGYGRPTSAGRPAHLVVTEAGEVLSFRVPTVGDLAVEGPPDPGPGARLEVTRPEGEPPVFWLRLDGRTAVGSVGLQAGCDGVNLHVGGVPFVPAWVDLYGAGQYGLGREGRPGWPPTIHLCDDPRCDEPLAKAALTPERVTLHVNESAEHSREEVPGGIRVGDHVFRFPDPAEGGGADGPAV